LLDDCELGIETFHDFFGVFLSFSHLGGVQEFEVHEVEKVKSFFQVERIDERE